MSIELSGQIRLVFALACTIRDLGWQIRGDVLDYLCTTIQDSLGANSTAPRRPLSVLSGNRARPALKSLVGKPLPPAAAASPAATATAAEVDAALDRLLLARTDLAVIISQVDPPPLGTLALRSSSPLVLADFVKSEPVRPLTK